MSNRIELDIKTLNYLTNILNAIKDIPDAETPYGRIYIHDIRIGSEGDILPGITIESDEHGEYCLMFDSNLNI